MIPHLFYYQLVVLGLLWLCVMLHAVWPSRCAISHQRRAEPEPRTSKRKRSSANPATTFWLFRAFGEPALASPPYGKEIWLLTPA
jgi:hypothetical protein